MQETNESNQGIEDGMLRPIFGKWCAIIPNFIIIVHIYHHCHDKDQQQLLHCHLQNEVKADIGPPPLHLREHVGLRMRLVRRPSMEHRYIRPPSLSPTYPKLPIP